MSAEGIIRCQNDKVIRKGLARLHDLATSRPWLDLLWDGECLTVMAREHGIGVFVPDELLQSLIRLSASYLDVYFPGEPGGRQEIISVERLFQPIGKGSLHAPLVSRKAAANIEWISKSLKNGCPSEG